MRCGKPIALSVSRYQELGPPRRQTGACSGAPLGVVVWRRRGVHHHAMSDRNEAAGVRLRRGVRQRHGVADNAPAAPEGPPFPIDRRRGT
jgi:hypothetical protein